MPEKTSDPADPANRIRPVPVGRNGHNWPDPKRIRAGSGMFTGCPCDRFRRPLFVFQRPLFVFQRPLSVFQRPLFVFQRPLFVFQRPLFVCLCVLLFVVTAIPSPDSFVLSAFLLRFLALRVALLVALPHVNIL